MATTVFPTTTGLALTANPDYEAWTSRGSGVVSATRPETDASSPSTYFVTEGGEFGSDIYWFTRPLQAVTISGTITVNQRAAESVMTANLAAAVSIDRCDIDGTVISNIAFGDTAVEMGTSEAARNWTPTVTSRTLVDGDRIRIRMGAKVLAGGVSTWTLTHWYAGTTSDASGDSYVTFTETLVEYTPPTDSIPQLRAPRMVGQAVARASSWCRRHDGLFVPQRRIWAPG
jgi:hypothetical protein